MGAKIQQNFISASVFTNKNEEIFNWLNSNILKIEVFIKKEEFPFFSKLFKRKVKNTKVRKAI
ncbi:hypothetical protein [Flavobacterium ustbae]|uniref:hypothetical protein n=1 Tax=Flavobacterium ustbae TaxID=2488790 RepID=UPI000F786B37|nr:hypothetical protein [Flavobacterium ustbae]